MREIITKVASNLRRIHHPAGLARRGPQSPLGSVSAFADAKLTHRVIRTVLTIRAFWHRTQALGKPTQE